MRRINIVKSTKATNKFTLKSAKNYVLITVCGILVATSVFLTIETATSGAEVANLDKTTAELTNQKRVLEESLVKGISMSQLQEKSVELGFVKPENLVYVSGVAPVANLP